MRNLLRRLPYRIARPINDAIFRAYRSLGVFVRTLGVMPLIAGGSTALPAAGETGLTMAQLRDEITRTIAESVNPLVESAIAPYAKTSGDMSAALTLLTKRHTDDANDPEKLNAALGKYPIGRKVRALALAQLEIGRKVEGNPDDLDAAIRAVKKHWSKSQAEPTERWLTYAKTTLLAGNAFAAGDMIMPSYDPEWVELLRNNAVVRGICRTLPMPRGATSRRKQTDAGTAYYQGETEKLTPSNQRVSRVSLAYKKLTALTVVSNDLIRFTSGESDRFVQEDLLRVMALREDRAFLVGNPPTDAAGSPQGIRYQTSAAHVNASAGTSLANFQSDLTNAIQLVETANIGISTDNGYWLMSPKTFWTIYALTTTTGDWVFAQELLAGRLFGYRILKTTQLAVGNSWIGASGGMIIFCHAPSLEIHDSMQRTLTVWPGGAYHDATAGAVLSGISQDETVITCISEHDFLQVYDKAVAVLTGYSS